MNVVTVPAGRISLEVVQRFHLVPDTHDGQPEWYKIAVMDHVSDEMIEAFLSALSGQSDP